MDGFLSDSTRDAIAVIGLVLGIIQVLMAVLSSSGLAPRRGQHRVGNGRHSGLPDRLLSKLRKPSGIFGNPGDLSKAIAIFLGLGVIVFGGFYILVPSIGDDMSTYHSLIFILAMLCLNGQIFLLFGFMMAAQEILEDSSEVFGRFFQIGEGAFAYGVISLVVLSVSSLFLQRLESAETWFLVAIKSYLYMGLIWSCIILIGTTIFGGVEVTKGILRKR